MAFIRSKYVCNDFDNGFTAQVGYKHYKLGFLFNKDGVRLKLIWWHYCKHFRYDKQKKTN